jgi:hypothetical protein
MVPIVALPGSATVLVMPKTSSDRTTIAAAAQQLAPHAGEVGVGVNCCDVVEVRDGIDRRVTFPQLCILVLLLLIFLSLS